MRKDRDGTASLRNGSERAGGPGGGARAEPRARRWNLWGYIDERDAAAACRLALEAPAEAVAGSPSFIIAAAGTVSLTRDVGEFGTLLAIDRARQALGFEPSHSWRDQMTRDQMT
jgi:nucleoside-diphosphate-sugar epimerase